MPAETRNISGTVVAITGATAGIGAATARLLVEAGAKVVIGGRRGERLDELVSELGAQNAVGVVMDVRSIDDNKRLVQAAVDTFGKLDTIIPNAGIGYYGSIIDHSDDVIGEMMETNYAGTVWSIRAAVPHFLENNGGDIVIVASVAGFRGGANEAVYAGTKHAQVGLAGSLDRELREKGIRVTAICPAGVETEFAMGSGRTPGDPILATYLRPEDVAAAIIATLQQPRRVRTTVWQMWSMGQQS